MTTTTSRPQGVSVFEKARAFIKRDFLIESSYPIAFVTTNLNAFIVLFLFYFVSRLIDPTQEGLARFGVDYFAFTFVGYIFYMYFDQALGSFSRAIQREQMSGSLEAMLATQTAPHFCLLMSSLYYSLYAGAQLAVLIVAGVVAGVDFTSANLVGAVVVFALAALTFMSIGILSASGILVFKRGDPLSWLLTGANFVLGGAFFPVEVMPEMLQQVSRVLPATHALLGLRLALLKGASLAELVPSLLALGVMLVVLAPLAMFALRAALRKARRDGSLVHF